MNMDEVYADKASFAFNELTDVLCRATRYYVEGCKYEQLSNGREVVHVYMGDDSLDVNVTCDSPWAMLKDVVRAVDGLY